MAFIRTFYFLLSKENIKLDWNMDYPMIVGNIYLKPPWNTCHILISQSSTKKKNTPTVPDFTNTIEEVVLEKMIQQ